jgi:hypothetical protein
MDSKDFGGGREGLGERGGGAKRVSGFISPVWAVSIVLFGVPALGVQDLRASHLAILEQTLSSEYLCNVGQC